MPTNKGARVPLELEGNADIENSNQDDQIQLQPKQQTNYFPSWKLQPVSTWFSSFLFVFIVLSIGIGIGIIIGYFGITNHTSTTNTNTITHTIYQDTRIIPQQGERIDIINCLQQSLTLHEIESVILPQSPSYFNESQVFSKFYQNYPLAIVKAATETTISKVLLCGGKYGVTVTPRCGGHGNAGNAVQTGSITLDLKLMRNVSYNHNDHTVIVGAGNTAGTATYYLTVQSNGTRALPIGQKPSVGMSGLTLGGGFGFSTRYVGFLCDNLISVGAVLTNGSYIIATKQSYADLFFASCGGGGGSFAVITQFHFKTIDVTANVTVFHFYFPLRQNMTYAIEKINAYQNFSYAFNPKATVNLEIINNTEGSLTGFYYGNVTSFYQSLAIADPNHNFPSSHWVLQSMNYIDAVIGLSGWDSLSTFTDLLNSYENERNYYQFKSYYLFENLHIHAIEMMLQFFVINGTLQTGLIFEFQSLGGVESQFSLVSPLDTAVSHRNARHCLMLKSWGPTRSLGDEMFGVMSNFSFYLGEEIAGEGAYVNHMDYELWNYQASYYGITLPNYPVNYTIEKLSDIANQYDPLNVLKGFQLF